MVQLFAKQNGAQLKFRASDSKSPADRSDERVGGAVPGAAARALDSKTALSRETRSGMQKKGIFHRSADHLYLR